MRIGLQVSADRGRYATKVEKLQADARWADEAGLDTIWTPQIPDEIDVMTAVTLLGTATSRIEIGTSIVPLQPRHPVVLAQQALSNQAVCQGRFTLGLGVSHHWIIKDMMGLPYERQALTMRCYLDVLDQALGGPGVVEVKNELFDIHQPLDITDLTPTPVLIAALGPMMLELAGARADGTVLWLADERTIASHVVPAITKAAEGAGRPAPRIMAGVPVCLCRDDEVEAAIERTNRTLSEVVASPNYVRLMEHGDAQSIGDVLVCGSETAMEERLRGFAEAGVTDLNCRDQGVGRADTGIPGLGRAGHAQGQLALQLAVGARMPDEMNCHMSSAACVGSCGFNPEIVGA
jgi:F420-dependent oxidoreductase-like protein